MIIFVEILRDEYRATIGVVKLVIGDGRGEQGNESEDS